MDQIVAKELEIKGSHGIQAYKYEEIFSFISKNNIDLGQMVSKTVQFERRH